MGWHDHHYKCYLTTHGTDLPGKPAQKKRQDVETNTNYSINIPRPALIAKYQQERIGLMTTTPKSPKKSEVNENFKEILYEIKVISPT